MKKKPINIFSQTDALVMPADLINDKKLDPIAFRILAYIYRVCNMPNKEFYRSMSTISNDLDITRQTVSHRLKYLIKYGYVIQISQDIKTHVYHLKLCQTCTRFIREAVNLVNNDVNAPVSLLNFNILSKMMQYDT